MSGDLEKARAVNLTTFRKNGQQVDTPVWVVQVGDKFYVNTESASAKLKRIRNNPRIRIAPCTLSGKPLGEWREGSARIVSDAALIARVTVAIRAKYGWQARIPALIGLFSRRVRERTTIEVQVSG